MFGGVDLGAITKFSNENSYKPVGLTFFHRQNQSSWFRFQYSSAFAANDRVA